MLVAISVASLACGLCFVLLGWLRGGDLVRYVPLPVVGGFLAGVGGLLIKASLVAPLGPAAAAGLPWSLLQGDAPLHWLPGVIAGLILWLLQARHSSFLNMPLVLGVLIAGFWLAALVSGATRGELAAAGWLYADLPADRLWSAGQHLGGLDLVAWRLLPGHALEFLTLLVVTTIAMLLTANSIELSVGRDIDLNRELRWLGLGNLLVGGLGALPGYHSTSGSILTHRLGTPWRAVGALTAALCLAMLLIGPGLLPLMPKLVTGTILFHVGLGLTVDWLCRTFSRMHPADWLVLFLVFGFVAFVGLIEGLAIGVAAGLVIFVLRYSRIDVVRNIASGATLRSDLERSAGRQGCARAARRGDLHPDAAGLCLLRHLPPPAEPDPAPDARPRGGAARVPRARLPSRQRGRRVRRGELHQARALRRGARVLRPARGRAGAGRGGLPP